MWTWNSYLLLLFLKRCRSLLVEGTVFVPSLSVGVRFKDFLKYPHIHIQPFKIKGSYHHAKHFCLNVFIYVNQYWIVGNKLSCNVKKDVLKIHSLPKRKIQLNSDSIRKKNPPYLERIYWFYNCINNDSLEVIDCFICLLTNSSLFIELLHQSVILII